MATILLIGRDPALLEGLSQMLAHAGHSPHVAGTAHEAAELAAAGSGALVVLAEQAELLGHPELARLPLRSGGALLIYHDGSEPPAPLPPPLQRLVMAALTLPLERHRLIALVQRVAERVQATGRGEDRAPDSRLP